MLKKGGFPEKLTSTTATYFTVDRRKRRCCLLAKAFYIGGATIFTCALLLEGIFIRILLVPYLQESNFSPTQCVLQKTFYEKRAGMQRCESRCTKVASAFPCLVIWVMFLKPENNSWHYGFLFDQIESFQKRRPYSCSIRPCKQRRESNAMSVILFNRSLSQTPAFPCYLRDDAVILKKLRDFSTTAHAIFWPAFTALASSLLLLIFWRLVGCVIWNDDGTHASNTVNEISLTHFRV